MANSTFRVKNVLSSNNGGSLTTNSIFNSAQKILTKEERAAQGTSTESTSYNNGGILGGIGYLGEKIGLGFLNSIEGIWDYVAGGLAKAFGADDWAEQQFSTDWVNYNHADEWYNPSEGWQVAGDVAGGIGSSLPSMAALAVVGYATGGAGVPAMVTTFFTSGLSAAGNATKEAYQATGELGGKEFGYGALSGLTEGTVETFSDAILGGIGGKITKSFSKDLATSIARKSVGKQLASSFFSEGFEEVIGTVLEPYWKRMTYDPTAENASVQEIAYAGFVGGLSGLIMDGAGITGSKAHSLWVGNKAVNNSSVQNVINQSQSIVAFETQNNSDSEFTEAITDKFSKLQASLATTNGEVQTVGQKILVGELQKLNTGYVLTAPVVRSAENIVENAETIAARINEYGYKDANGNPINVTAEQLRAGIDTSTKRSTRRSFKNALKTNSALRTLAVFDATGQIFMDTAKYQDSMLKGRQLGSQVDLNRFIEQSTDAEKAAVAEKLGISDWNTLTNDELSAKLGEFVNDGGVEEYRQERATVKEVQGIDASTSKPLPRSVSLASDGAVRFSLGDSDIAVIKSGDSYKLYDYETGKLSKALTEQEMNKTLRQAKKEIEAAAESRKNAVNAQTATTEQSTDEAQTARSDTEFARQTKEIDSYCRENIKDYSKLGESAQSMIRAVIRNGRAAGVEESFLLSAARVSAHSGLNIVFSKELSFVAANGTYADGAIDLKSNRIIINPEARTRTGEMILIHELTHAIYNTSDGYLTAAVGLETMSETEKENIRKRYSAIGHGGAIEVSDEINAHFAENTLTNKNILERLTKSKPTLKEKILSFFKKSSVDYSDDVRLDGAAKRLYKQYKKLFERFSNGTRILKKGGNFGTNAFESAVKTQTVFETETQAASETETNNKSEQKSYTLDNSSIRLAKPLSEYPYDEQKVSREYVNAVDSTIQKHAELYRANKNNPRFVRDTICDVTPEMAEKIKAEVGVDVTGSTININKNGYNHIESRHGVNGTADHSMAHTEDVARIGYVLQNYDTLTALKGADGKQRYSSAYIDSNNNKAPLVVFSKKIDGTYFCSVAAVDSVKGKLWVETAYISKKGLTYALNAETALSSQSSETVHSSRPSTNSISETTEKVNSKGKKLSAEQAEYFKHSKVVDGNGNLLVVYHGSSVGDITQFRLDLGGAYFTANEQYAKRYARNSNNAKVYECYLDMRKPFDTRNAKARKIYENEFVEQHYGNDTPLTESGLPDWNEGYNLVDFLKSKGYDYDGILLNEGADGGYGQEVKERGISYVVFDAPNQVKLVSNGNPSKSNDIRYALPIDGENVAVEVEETKDLVALHNLTEDKLLRVLELGGFPMPSIAITKTSLPHENYGDITVVFGKETIDPESDSRNHVYDRDAWTPTAPTVDIKLNTGKVDTLISDLKKSIGDRSAFKSAIGRFFDGKYRDNNGDYVVSEYDYNKKSFGERAINNSGIVAAYLSEKGLDVEPVYAEREFTLGWSSLTREEAAKLLETVGITKDITFNNITEEQKAQVLEKYVQYKARKNSRFFKKNNPDITYEEIADMIRGEYGDGNVSQLLLMADDFYNESRPKDVYDEDATLKKMRSEINDEQDFYSWFWEKIESTFDKKGIDNDSDVFDRRGNRRSFEQRHYSYTVENIVKAMSKGDQTGQVTFGMSAGALAARLSRQFTSIEDIRDAKQYLALVSEEDLKAFNDRTYQLYDELVTKIAGQTSDFMTNANRRDDVGNILAQCATVRPLDVANIKRKFNSETKGYDLNYRFNDQIAEKVLSFFETLKHIPTTYFEAKPRRAVSFSEIKSVLIPESASKQLKTQLKKHDIDYQVYGTGENARNKIIKQMDGVRFALPETDSQGRKLTEEQRKFFADSKVIDEKGRLIPVYHGTRNPDFTVFKQGKEDGALGAGMYFAESQEYAKGFSFGTEPYKCYLNITNPYIAKYAGGIDQSKLIEKGYDGVYNPSNKFWVAFRSEQIKLTTNKNPTSDVDIRYALPETDSNGKTLTDEQREFFKDSKVTDSKGRLLKVYHGTKNDFFVFDTGRLGKGTEQFGCGFYFATNKEVSESYGGRVVESYLNIKKPFVINSNSTDNEDINKWYNKTVTAKQAYEILQYHPDLYSAEDSPIGNYVEEYWEQGATDKLIRECAAKLKHIGDFYDNSAFGYNLNEMLAAFNAVLGYDGIQVNFGDGSKYYVAWFNNQIKLTSNKTPTQSSDIRYALADDGTQAVMTTERIDDLISSSGAGKRTDYARMWITSINPTDFINLTVRAEHQDRATFDEKVRGDYDSTMGQYDYAKALKESEAPYLQVRMGTGKIIGHNGRHRMRLLEQQGIKSAEIVVEFFDVDGYWVKTMNGEGTPLETIKRQKIKNQWDTNQSAYLENLMPLNRAFREQVLATYGETTAASDSDIRYALMNDNSFADNVHDVLTMSDKEAKANKAAGNFISVMKNTPDVILNNVEGAENLEIIIRFDSLYLAVREGGVLDGNYHALGEEIAKKLPDLITNPDAIVRMDNGRLNIFAEMKTDKGNSGVISIELNTVKDINSKNSKYNLVVSAFGAKDNYVRNLLQKHAVQVEYMRKGLSQVNHQLHNSLATINDKPNLSNSISQSAENVNSTDKEILTKRYALPTDSDSDEKKTRQMSKGQRAKFAANNTGYKFYTRAEAEEVINSILGSRMDVDEQYYGVISGKTKAQAIDTLFTQLNSTPEGYRASKALRLADYIIDNTILTDIYSASTDNEEQINLLAALRSQMHSFDLSGIKGDIKYRYDKKAASIYSVWGAKKGTTGRTADVIMQDVLSQYGVQTDSMNEADIFFEIVDLYERTRDSLNAKVEKMKLSAYDGKKNLEQRRQEIAKDILRAYDEKGTKTKYAKLVEKYTAQIKQLTAKVRDSERHNSSVNSLLDKTQRIRDWKTGTFVNATTYKTKIFKGSIEKLGQIKNRGNLNRNGTRRIIAGLASWYTQENPILNYESNERTGLYNQEIADILQAVSQNQKPLTESQSDIIAALQAKSGLTDYAALNEWYTRRNLKAAYDTEVKQLLRDLASETTFTTEELKALGKVVDYFSHFIETYNKVYRDGKYVEAQPLVNHYIEVLHNNKNIKLGLLNRAFNAVFDNSAHSYMETFSDSMAYVRWKDKYQDGFYTEMMTELRNGGISASALELEIREPLENFMQQHKKYASELSKRTIKVGTHDMPATQAFLLYMTLNREQSLQGLAQSGFVYNDGKETVRVDGFARGEYTLEELRTMAKAEQEKLYKQFTETDREYISVAEQIFNESCKKAKRDTDMLRQGYSNVTEGYYVPISRANIARSADTNATFFDEMNRVSNASFNKDTVKGAKGELRIEGLDTVLDRHIHAVSMYAGLATAIDQYDMLYNLNTSENANKVVTVATESANTWANGDAYMRKIISDMQGISPVRGGVSKAFSFLRSGYAKYQLGLNPKVWVTQFSSLFAASSRLDYTSIVKGFGVKSGDVDEYCALAKIRNSDNTAAMAQGVIDKVGKVGDVLMKPIGMVDRFVVKKLYGACQVQVAKEQGLKIGTQENKVAAGKLLETVILETQQNSMATERSAAMRSGNEMLKTLTMFTADSMKVFGRVVDSIGEVTVLRARIKATTDANVKAELQAQLKTALKKVRKSATALVSSAVFMALIAEAFRWLYNKDRDEDESVIETMVVDAVGNLLGGLPFIKDLYAQFTDGYDLTDYSYSAINDLFSSFTTLINTIFGNTSYKSAYVVKSFINAVGQIFGIPTRNIYNVVYGLIKRVSPTTAYQIDSAFYSQSYTSDLKEAIANDDEDMIATIVGIMLNERVGGVESEAVRNELNDLTTKGYSVLPKSIGSTITYDGEEITLTSAQQMQLKSVYAQAMSEIEKMLANKTYKGLSDEQKAKAISKVYDAYYNKALETTLGVSTGNKVLLASNAISLSKLAPVLVALSTLESDKDSDGKTVQSSKKKKVIKLLLQQTSLSDGERLLLLYYSGYTLKDKEYKGKSATAARRILLKYLLKLNVSKNIKIQLAEMCDFTVKNGKIVTSSV